MNSDIRKIANNDFKHFVNNDAVYYVGYMFYNLRKMGVNTDNLLSDKNNKQLYVRKLFNKILVKVLKILNIILDPRIDRFDNEGRRITKNEFIGMIVSYMSIIDYLSRSIHFTSEEKPVFQNLSIDCIYDLRNKSQQKSLRSDISQLYKMIKA